MEISGSRSSGCPSRMNYQRWTSYGGSTASCLRNVEESYIAGLVEALGAALWRWVDVSTYAGWKEQGLITTKRHHWRLSGPQHLSSRLLLYSSGTRGSCSHMRRKGLSVEGLEFITDCSLNRSLESIVLLTLNDYTVLFFYLSRIRDSGAYSCVFMTISLVVTSELWRT